ncbi:thioredoxin domain-containing protein [Erythrobacter arachoides]|uniref:Thioredoxin domain-containing protein n=1 Tax=Aurantiacibacter arachoides TaxID=1850444 RepID=A0A845A488_9SPHN|nr:thioredoxin domain-containing protein [Aurantiacibacter arachoides]MXO93727.1 thioredoxin domain-containing protein [Aurantiacibacter arachoides]GGD47113.1 thiol-disulfide oxidoreductase [Aurantiacibacter arachoides]
MTTRFAAAIAVAVAMPVAVWAVPAAAQNWNAQYAQTATGHRVGNPDADIQLIEYVSYTCPHCAQFEQESEAELRYFYVHEGQATVEVRHFIRNIVDIVAAVSAECGGADAFYDNHRMFLNSQDEWMERGRALSAAQQARWGAGDWGSRMRAIASDLDFYEMMEPRGLSRTQLDACLVDQSRAERIVAMSDANAAEFGVQGTPSFVLNGALLDGVHSWQGLREVLVATRETPPAALQ